MICEGPKEGGGGSGFDLTFPPGATLGLSLSLVTLP